MIESARGHDSPAWPLPAVTRKRWTFGAPRKGRGGRARKHAGLDMYAPRGSVVLAPEGGVVVATQKFNGPNAHAILIQTDTGPVILLGEVEPGSWRKHRVELGSRVERGQPVADVGINPGGSQMLHVEMYRAGTRSNFRWYADQAPPRALLDPTQYFRTAAALDAEQDVDEDDDQVDDDHKDCGDDCPDDDVGSCPPGWTRNSSGECEPPTTPKDPPKKVSGLFDSGWVIMAIIALAVVIDRGDA